MREFVKKLFSVAALFALPLMIVSCGKDNGELSQSSISPRKTAVGTDADSMFVAISAEGNWTVELEYTEGASGWASISPSQGSGSIGNAIFKYAQNPGTDSRSVTLVLKPSRGLRSSATIVQEGLSTSESKGVDVSTLAWMELPATLAGDGREFFYHTMTNAGNIVRNYSFDYSYKDFISLWVAYPLNRSLIGKTYGRSEAWGFDPLLPSSKQQYIYNSYGIKGYDRGHQIPSADRQGTYERNAATYYATNMTPQKSDFNQGIWAELEMNVRDICYVSDTLYVVTGCVLGSETIYNNGHSVNVPSAYFKALLFYSKASPIGEYGGYSGVGVFMPHDESLSGPSYDYAMTLDALQQETGLEFFVNLPENIRSKVLVQNPSWARSYLN